MVKDQYNVLLMFVVLGVALSGCATKAGPARSVGFIPAAQLSKLEDLPFHSAWRKPGVDWDRYTKIHVADKQSGDHSSVVISMNRRKILEMKHFLP